MLSDSVASAYRGDTPQPTGKSLCHARILVTMVACIAAVRCVYKFIVDAVRERMIAATITVNKHG